MFFNMVYTQFRILIFFSIIGCYLCWQSFTPLGNLSSLYTERDTEHVYGEYIFGDCIKSPKQLYDHVYKDHTETYGKLIVRGWLNITRIPTCILLRSTSYEEELFRSATFRFQMCVARITYYHTITRYYFYYYEWYIPPDMIGGMNWDIYFYGPKQYSRRKM